MIYDFAYQKFSSNPLKTGSISVPLGSQELLELTHKLIALGMNRYLVMKFWNEKQEVFLLYSTRTIFYKHLHKVFRIVKMLIMY